MKIFQNILKYFSCYILLTDQISLSGCIYFVRYYAICVVNVYVFAYVIVNHNTSHKFWDQSPSPYYQTSLQVFETVSWHKIWCCYSSNMRQHWEGWRDLIYFCKVDHSRILRDYSRNWLGLNNLCEMLWQVVRS